MLDSLSSPSFSRAWGAGLRLMMAAIRWGAAYTGGWKQAPAHAAIDFSQCSVIRSAAEAKLPVLMKWNLLQCFSLCDSYLTPSLPFPLWIIFLLVFFKHFLFGCSYLATSHRRFFSYSNNFIYYSVSSDSKKNIYIYINLA